MRVLHVYRTFFPDTQGGAEEMIRQLTVGLQSIDIEARVFVPSPNPEPKSVEVDGVLVIRAQQQFEIASCGFALTALPEFKRQVAWADIVHYHFPWPFADLLNLAAGVKKPIVITYHSDIVRQVGLMALYRPLMNAFLKRADAIVATSSQYRDSSQTLGDLDRSIDVVPIGVDESSYPIASETTKARMTEQYGSNFFFFVGMLRYYKGLNYLLEASRGSDFKVVIAGTGPEEEALKQTAKDLNLNNVVFAGRITDEEKVALIELSLAMVFPSHLRSEAFGVTLLEGLMKSKPLISAEVGTGTSFVNQDGETGTVVEAANPAALREAMLAMVADPALVKRFGTAARQRYESLFTADHMARGYADIYERLLARQVGPGQASQS